MTYASLGTILLLLSLCARSVEAQNIPGKNRCDNQDKLIYQNLRKGAVAVRVWVRNECPGSGHDVTVLQGALGKPPERVIDVPTGDTVRVDIDMLPNEAVFLRMQGSPVSGSYSYSVSWPP